MDGSDCPQRQQLLSCTTSVHLQESSRRHDTEYDNLQNITIIT